MTTTIETTTNGVTMTKFLYLTDANTGSPLAVRVDRIASAAPSGAQTSISMEDGTLHRVTEPPRQVAAMMRRAEREAATVQAEARA